MGYNQESSISDASVALTSDDSIPIFVMALSNRLNAAHVLRNVLSILRRYSPSRFQWRSARKCQQLQRDHAW